MGDSLSRLFPTVVFILEDKQYKDCVEQASTDWDDKRGEGVHVYAMFGCCNVTFS